MIEQKWVTGWAQSNHEDIAAACNEGDNSRLLKSVDLRRVCLAFVFSKLLTNDLSHLNGFRTLQVEEVCQTTR